METPKTEKDYIKDAILKARQFHFDGKTPSDVDVEKLENELYDNLLEFSVNQQTTIDELRHLENDLELADKKIVTSSFWYFVQGLILGAIIMYLLINN